MAQTDIQTDGHGDSMTEWVQFGQLGQNHPKLRYTASQNIIKKRRRKKFKKSPTTTQKTNNKQEQPRTTRNSQEQPFYFK